MSATVFPAVSDNNSAAVELAEYVSRYSKESLTAEPKVISAVNPSEAKSTAVTVTPVPSAVIVKSDVPGPSVVDTTSENFTVTALAPSLVTADIIIGAVVSIIIALASAIEPVAPGDGKVRVASLPAKSFIVPESALTDA